MNFKRQGISIKEEDLMLIPNGINVKINEKIKEQFENNCNQ